MAAGTASIVKRPQGHFLGTCYDATVYNNGYGVAVISKTAHGLVTGNYVYIYSILSSYNGFWYVEVIGANDFEIREYPTASVQSFINSGSIQFCVSTESHNFSCLHLPIVYKLTNTLWPTNTGGTNRTVSSFDNDSGYVKLTLSGALDSFNALNYVKISGASSSSVNGTFQILTKTSTSVITINLAYNGAYSFSGGTIILYFNNYKVQVNIWAGLNSSHPWMAVNPYKKILSLAVIPDNNNIIKLNVNEYLKPSQNIISNNLQLDTLPNNTDFFSQFYIEFQEMYDQSDGSSVTTYSADLVSDQTNFEGVAVNAKLPFKNRYSGYLNDYLMNGAGKFLTIFSTPVLFACSTNLPSCYNDISFINPKNGIDITLKKEYYKSGTLVTTTNTDLGSSLGLGVIREKLTADCAYDRIDLTLVGSEVFDNGDFESGILSPWTNTPDGHSFIWDASTIGGDKSARMNFVDNIISNNERTIALRHSYNQINQTSKVFNYKIITGVRSSSLGTWSDSDFEIVYYRSGVEVNTEVVHILGNNATYTGSFTTVESNFDAIGIRLKLKNTGSPFSGTWRIDATLFEPNLTTKNISEKKTFKINCGCADQEIRLSWLNQLAGFDYWNFTGRSTSGLDITQVTQQNKNIFTNWPDSWGEFANTIRSESKRISFTRTLCRSQNVDEDQVEAIATLKSSPFVQIVNSQYDTRTVLIDSQSFDIRKDGDKNWSISFVMVYTDPVSSQEL